MLSMMPRALLAAIPMCMIFVALCTICAFAAPMERKPVQMDIPNLPAHPRLLLNSKGISEMKDRIERFDWAKTRWEAIKKTADGLLDEAIVLPPRGANWSHWYACPVHGCGLQTGKQIGQWQWEHKCPVGGEILSSDPTKPNTDYDGCVLHQPHNKLSRGVLDLGLVYQITGDARYASKAREILLAYADKYLTYPLHNTRGEAKIGGGRVSSQNLDESTWLIPLCQGADLIWETLSQSDRDTIASKLLIPAAKEVIQPGPHGIHNIQNWRNSAMGLVGFLLGDKDLIRYAIDNPDTGFRSQMENGVTADGQWWEGAWGYHFYTMSAIWPLTEAARNCGIDLYVPQYKAMHDAPLLFMMPNNRLPAFNDSGETNLAGESPQYELAYARYRDPICLELLSSSRRTNDFALWFGVPDLPSRPPGSRKCANYPRSGYAILTNGTGQDATWLCLKYGPHGGGHGHPDKLSFVLYARGQVLGVDPGTCRYGLPIRFDWYTTTLAHNTLVIDEQSQKPAEGRSIAFGSDKGVDYSVCDAGPIWDGVRFTRTAAMVDRDLIIFVDQIASDTEHTYDIVYHQRRHWTDLPSGVAWTPPDARGYKCLRDATSRLTDKGTALKIAASADLNVMIGLAGGEPTEIITATGIGGHVKDEVPAVIFRRKAKNAAFVWYIALNGKPAEVSVAPATGGNGRKLDESTAVAVRVTRSDGTQRLLVANPQEKLVRVLPDNGSRFETRSAFAVR